MIQWGYKDVSALFPLHNMTLDDLDRQVYNLMYHLRHLRSEILSWPSATRIDMWKRHLKQMDFEKSEWDKQNS